MFEKVNFTCMPFTPPFALTADDLALKTSEKVPLLKLFFCISCGCELLPMSAVPQGAFLASKIKQNEKKKKGYEINQNMELTPLHYNSKMMNSIWGLYNRYSVHNLKKNIDKNVGLGAVNQQIQSVASTASGTMCTTSPQVFTSAWDKMRSSFGNTH